MNTCMDEIANNISQVTNSISFSFESLFPTSVLSTGWKQGLSMLYSHKLHVLFSNQLDHLCNQVVEGAKNMKTTGDAVSYAMFLIDQKNKKNKDEEKARATNSLMNVDNVDFSSCHQSLNTRDGGCHR